MLKLLAIYLEKIIDIFWAFCLSVLGKRKPAIILTYIGHGNKEKIKIMGRVVEGIKPIDFSLRQTRLGHFLKVIRLFLTLKISKAELKINDDKKIVTNEEGFFSKDIAYEEKLELTIYNTHHRELPSESKKYNPEIIFPSIKTQNIIISDIDDTILKSRATNFLRLAFKTLFSPLSHRETFFEAANAYKALQVGPSRDQENLFFYVSSSSWNIYPLLKSFIQENHFPYGPIILQDVATEKRKKNRSPHQHKFDRISEIADFYPELPLILIGDAGQHDPHIYLRIAESYPDRVKLILIRNTWWTEQITNNQDVLEKAKKLNVKIAYFHELTEIQDEMTHIL